ncbi:MAG: DUF2779 domain-containing protein, partial [Bacteroidota bacterium]
MHSTSGQKYFTKTLFTVADGCPTKMFYHGKSDYTSSREHDEFLSALAEGGFQVGALAKCYFPEGKEVETSNMLQAVRQTQEMLTQDEVTIFEATFLFENFLVRTDILRKRGSHLELIEVKSKSFHPDQDEFLTKAGNLSAEWK